MAMVRQLTEVEIINGSAPTENEASSDQADNHSESQSASGSKRSTPVSMPSLQYSKEDLMKYSILPLSKNRPLYLDVAFNNIGGKWDPERWFMGHRGDRASSGDDGRLKRERVDDGLVSQKRKSSDPKERIKEEKDDIVLSPQRRSFGTGCHVVPQSSLARRPGSPLDGRDPDNFRDSNRRIGSGRIMTRDRDQRDWDRDRDYGYGSTRTDRRDRFDQDDDKDLRRFPNRYNRNDRRSRGRDRIDEVEPEWFSGGPTSQSETIELVGFEESQNGENRKQSKKNKKLRQSSRRSSLKSDEGENAETSASAEEPSHKKENIAPADQNSNPSGVEKTSENKNEVEGSDRKSNSGFDLDDLFRMDWIPGLMQNEIPPESAGSENSGIGCSRFSKWFKQESPKPDSQNNSRRSSLHEELITNVLNSITEPPLVIPSVSPGPRTSDSFFAPISPVLSHSMNFPMSQPQVSSSKDIMSILHTASAQSDAINGAKQADSKRVKDLEADLKRIVLGENSNNKIPQEKSAFDKLLQHMSESRDSPASSISIGPLDKSKALQEQDLLQDIMRDPQTARSVQSPSQAYKGEKHVPQHPPGFTPNQFVHLQPNQNELFAHLMQPPPKQHEMPMPHMQPQSQMQHQQQNQPQPMHGLTVDMLAKVFGTSQPQLSPLSPGLQNASAPLNQGDSINLLQYRQQQELLSSILKQQQQAVSLQRRQRPSTKDIPIQQTLGLPTLGISPRQSPLPPEAVSSAISSQGRIPSPLVFGQQPPALSHAPAPIHPATLAQAMTQPNAATSNTLQVQNPVVLQRVPSPQELAVHTQSILQNALIKRKLEEQKENFRKRQEAQRAISPVGANKNGASVSPLKGLSPTIAFTPTSVMRKIQSERSEIKEQRTLQNGSKLFENKLDPSSTSIKMNATSMDSGITIVSSSSVIPCSPNSGSLGQAIPRAVHGQTSSQPRPIHGSMNSAGGPVIQNQGRPIVKVGMNQNMNSGDLNRIGFNKPGLNPKQFISSGGQALNVHETDSGFDPLSKLSWQHQLMRQQQNAPPVPGLQMAATYAALNRPPPMNTHHPNLLRPVNMSSSTAPNLNFPILRNSAQNTMRAPPNAVNQINNLATALQLQQRATLDSRQLQALAQSQRFHPSALQQLLMNSQNQINVAQTQGITGFPGSRDVKHQHLLPGQSVPNRQSPVNLAKWFGSDVLKQKMPDMPPVPQQKALLVEEIERQQQQSTAVHN